MLFHNTSLLATLEVGHAMYQTQVLCTGKVPSLDTYLLLLNGVHALLFKHVLLGWNMVDI
jgi:hypothetical protein